MMYRRWLAVLGMGMLSWFQGVSAVAADDAAKSAADSAFAAYYRSFLDEEF